MQSYRQSRQTALGCDLSCTKGCLSPCSMRVLQKRKDLRGSRKPDRIWISWEYWEQIQEDHEQRRLMCLESSKTIWRSVYWERGRDSCRVGGGAGHLGSSSAILYISPSGKIRTQRKLTVFRAQTLTSRQLESRPRGAGYPMWSHLGWASNLLEEVKESCVFSKS